MKTEKGAGLIVFIILLIIVVGITLYFIDIKEAEDEKNIDKEYIALDAQTLYNDYVNNQIAAENKYKNNYYYFTGTIYDITNYWGDNYVEIRYKSLVDNSKIIRLTAYFDDVEELMNISKGNEVTIYGKFFQRSFDNYMGTVTSFTFKHCTFNK